MPLHPPETFAPPVPPYYLAFARGFFVEDNVVRGAVLSRNIRRAQPFNSFEEADAQAQKVIATGTMFHRYYAVLRGA